MLQAALLSPCLDSTLTRLGIRVRTEKDSFIINYDQADGKQSKVMYPNADSTGTFYLRPDKRVDDERVHFTPAETTSCAGGDTEEITVIPAQHLQPRVMVAKGES